MFAARFEPPPLSDVLFPTLSDVLFPIFPGYIVSNHQPARIRIRIRIRKSFISVYHIGYIGFVTIKL